MIINNFLIGKAIDNWGNLMYYTARYSINKGEFSASFDEHRVIKYSEDLNEDEIEGYFDEYPVDCSTYREALEAVEKIEGYMEEVTFFDIYDCSCSNDTVIETEDFEVAFKSESCGQLDLLNIKNFKFLKDDYKIIYDFWKRNHLKVISDDEKNILNTFTLENNFNEYDVWDDEDFLREQLESDFEEADKNGITLDLERY